jgi:hypothetical protein
MPPQSRTPVKHSQAASQLLIAAIDQARLRSGNVLAIPEGSVIDTGDRKIVYREVAEGTYDGVEVRLGPRCDMYYPVVSGLAAGDRVVTTGSFLIDAETRLNPAAGSIYVGGSSGSKSTSTTMSSRPASAESDEKQIRDALAELSPADAKLAEAQRYCPVTEMRLGSMGKPDKIMVQGRAVFLCCSGCEESAKSEAAKTLAAVDKYLRGEKPEGTK